MALTNNINVDLGLNTITSTTLSAANTVESLTYNLSANTITFGIRPVITITATDLLHLIDLIVVFQTAINFNYSLNQNAASPFTSVTVAETNGGTHWDLSAIVNGAPRFINYSALNASTINLNNRTVIQTLSYPEWLLIYQSLVHYRSSVKQFLNI